MKHKTILFVVFPALLIILSCSSFFDNKQEEMQTAALKLDKLTKMVEAAVRYEDMTLERGERALLICATAEDEDLFHWLDERYQMKVAIRAGHAVVLICSKNGKEALYEDTNCVAGPDVTLWQSKNECSFTLTEEDIIKMCE